MQYFFQIDGDVVWSQNTNGPEPIFDQGAKGPVPELLAASGDPSWVTPKPATECVLNSIMLGSAIKGD